MSLRTRVAALIAVTVLIASTIGGIGVALSSRNVGRDRIDDELRADIAAFDANNPRLAAQLALMVEVRRAACEEGADAVTGGNGAGIAATAGQRETQALNRLGRLGPVLTDFASSMQVIRSDGFVAPGCRTLPIDDREALIAESGVGTAIRTVSIDGARHRMMTAGLGVGAVQVARDLDLTESTLRGLVTRIIGFGAIGALLAGLVGWFFARRATEPIKRLNEAANRVATTRDLGERMEVEGNDEVGTLAASFNVMLSSLDTSREQQRRLVQDASHELRTPLTSMRTNVELLLRHQDVDPTLRTQMLSDIGDELNELSELTAELVDSATEVSSNLDRMTPFDLADVVTECVERGRRRHRRDITLELSTAEESVVLGDHSLLTRALTNLINNAVKFCDADAEIIVASHGTSVRVLDRGPGIPAADLPHVFERFYRATSSRSAPGSGLGLAIVKQIVDGHGGKLHVANRTGGGLEVGFSLPLDAAPRA
ncbi:MAG: HAMP domain-containing sensor histidine kinase [Actinomycetota bacterium]